MTQRRTGTPCRDDFGRLLTFGVAAMILFAAVANLGANLTLLPVTGIPLPFFSYGGSFMLASWLAIGILVRISADGRGGRTGPFAI